MASTMEFKEIVFPGEETKFIAPTWNDLQELAFIVATEIRKDGKKFDRIVTLAKGGWPMTRSLVDFLEVGQVASIGVKFYQGINRRLNRPEIYQDLPIELKGEKVLLFDDVADTGESLEFTTEYLKGRHGEAEVTTAALFYKPHSLYQPEYYGAKTSAWIIFPYDMVESFHVLGKKWRDKGLSDRECRERFGELGFQKRYIDYYFT